MSVAVSGHEYTIDYNVAMTGGGLCQCSTTIGLKS